MRKVVPYVEVLEILQTKGEGEMKENTGLPNISRWFGEGLFNGCANLTGVTLPENLEQICAFAFRDCTALTSMEFPATFRLSTNGNCHNCPQMANLK